MRNLLTRLMAVCFIWSFAFMLLPVETSACSCAEKENVKSAFSRADAVFVGKVSKVKVKKSLLGPTTVTVVFDVNKSWKGPVHKTLQIKTGLGGGDCGYNFEEGQSYIVYANESDMYGSSSGLAATICSRTAPSMEAMEDYSALGEGKTPLRQESNENRYFAFIAAGFLTLTAAIGFLIWRKKIR